MYMYSTSDIPCVLLSKQVESHAQLNVLMRSSLCLFTT